MKENNQKNVDNLCGYEGKSPKKVLYYEGWLDKDTWFVSLGMRMSRRSFLLFCLPLE